MPMCSSCSPPEAQPLLEPHALCGDTGAPAAAASCAAASSASATAADGIGLRRLPATYSANHTNTARDSSRTMSLSRTKPRVGARRREPCSQRRRHTGSSLHATPPAPSCLPCIAEAGPAWSSRSATVGLEPGLRAATWDPRGVCCCCCRCGSSRKGLHTCAAARGNDIPTSPCYKMVPCPSACSKLSAPTPRTCAAV